MSKNLTASMRRYHEWVSTLSCSYCGIVGFSQVAHYQGIRGDAFKRGLSIKANDILVVPLCCARPNEKGCHAKFDDNELSEFEDRYMRKIDQSEMFLYWVGLTLILAHRLGLIVEGKL